MPSKKAFFSKKENKEVRKKGSLKRKKEDKSIKNDVKAKKSKYYDEEITSESETEEVVKEVLSEESDHETAQEKRTRLAKKMLEDIKETVSKDDTEVNEYLRNQVLESRGKLFHQVADEYARPNEDDIKFCTWSGLGIVTCIAVSSDSRFIFSGCKNGHIVKWSLPDCKKIGIIKRIQKGDDQTEGHGKDVTCLAISQDGKYLASGGSEKLVFIWDPHTLQHVYTFMGHRSRIMCLSFQVGTNILFSGSQDKMVKRWNVAEKAYAETLYGHEDAVMAIDCSAQERAVSAGGMDNSLRFWKIPEESHLPFGGRMSNIDCVKLVDNGHFISASCDNKLTLWSIDSRKPRCVITGAHGTLEGQHWISSVATLRQHDIAASGGYDGALKFWKISNGLKSLEFLFSVQLEGYLNGIQFTEDGQHVVVGIGKEHRLGRWFEPIKTVKNSIAVIKLDKKNLANGD